METPATCSTMFGVRLGLPVALENEADVKMWVARAFRRPRPSCGGKIGSIQAHCSLVKTVKYPIVPPWLSHSNAQTNHGSTTVLNFQTPFQSRRHILLPKTKPFVSPPNTHMQPDAASRPQD